MKNTINKFNETIKEIHIKTSKSYVQIFLDILRCWIKFGRNYEVYYVLKLYEINDDEKYELLDQTERKIFGKGFSLVKLIHIMFVSMICYFIFEYSPLWSLIFYLLTYKHIDTDKLSTIIIKFLGIGVIFSIGYGILFYIAYIDYLDGSGIVYILGIIGRAALWMIPEIFVAGMLSDYVIFPLIDRFIESLDYKVCIFFTIVIGIAVILAIILVIILTYAYMFLI